MRESSPVGSTMKSRFLILLVGFPLAGLCDAQSSSDVSDPAAPKQQDVDMAKEIESLKQRLSDVEAFQGTKAAPEQAEGKDADDSDQDTTRGEDAGLNLRANDRQLTGEDLIDESFPRSWPLFGSDYRMAIGGYVKLDFLKDFSGTGDRFQFVTSTIPVEGTAEANRGGYTNMFARETRIHFDVRRTTAGRPPEKYFLEFDFFDNGENPYQTKARLRHAYMVQGRLLAGRTWGTLTDVRSLVQTIDFAAGDALNGARVAQIRWEDKLSDRTKWAVALESQEFFDIDDVADQGGKGTMSWPNLVARIIREWDHGFTLFGGQIGQLNWDGEGVGPDADALQWYLAWSGRYAPTPSSYFVWNASYGNGAANSILSFVGTGGNAVLTPSGELETMPDWNVSLGYGHKLSSELAANLGLAHAGIDPSDLRASDSMKSGGTAHANLIWTATDALSTGIEYMVGQRTNADGADGKAHRLQCMVKYSF